MISKTVVSYFKFVIPLFIFITACGEITDIKIESEQAPPPQSAIFGKLAPTDANGIFVDGALGSEANPGTMAAPVATIGRAMWMAEAAGKSVYVAGGVYNQSIWVKTNLYCGYNADGWSFDPENYPTTINGSKWFGLFVEDAVTSEIDGCQVNGGSSAFTRTAGIVARGDVTLNNNRVDGGSGTALTYGVLAGSPAGCNLLATNNIISSGNASAGNSTGFVNRKCTAKLINNTIIADGGANHSIGFNSWSGAISSVLVNNIFAAGDLSEDWAVAADDPSQITLVSNALIGSGAGADARLALRDGFGAFTKLQDAVDINNCAGWTAHCAEASGNVVDTDAQFVDAASGDYHLAATSPAFNTGIDPVSYYAGTAVDADPDGDARPLDGAWDIGYDEVYNDDFIARYQISGATGTYNESTINATKEAGEPNHIGNLGGSSVWFTWTAPDNGELIIDSIGSNFDTLLVVYTGSDVAALTMVVQNDDIDASTPQSQVVLGAVSGQQYQIVIDGFGGDSGDLTLNWDFTLAGPANDNFADSTQISGSSGLLNQSNFRASEEAGEPDHAGNAGGTSVWYDWKAPDDGTLTLSTNGSDFNTLLAVYTGTSLPALVLVASDDDGGNGYSSQVTFTVTFNTTYRIVIDGYDAAEGTVQLNWTHNLPGAPANDNFVDAQPISGDSGTTSGDNTLASKEAGEPKHAGQPGSTSVWYKWTATQAGWMTLDTIDSDFDTLLAAYTGVAVSSLTVVTSNNDAFGVSRSAIGFMTIPGTTYYIVVDGNKGASGNISLDWVFDAGGSGPTNDAFADRIVLVASSGVTTTTNMGATREAGEPKHSNKVGGASVWWRWTAPSAGTLTLQTIGSNFDTLLAVYSGGSISTLVSEASKNTPNGQETLNFAVTAGTIYQIAVDGYRGDVGDITLTWSLAP